MQFQQNPLYSKSAHLTVVRSFHKIHFIPSQPTLVSSFRKMQFFQKSAHLGVQYLQNPLYLKVSPPYSIRKMCFIRKSSTHIAVCSIRKLHFIRKSAHHTL